MALESVSDFINDARSAIDGAVSGAGDTIDGVLAAIASATDNAINAISAEFGGDLGAVPGASDAQTSIHNAGVAAEKAVEDSLGAGGAGSAVGSLIDSVTNAVNGVLGAATGATGTPSSGPGGTDGDTGGSSGGILDGVETFITDTIGELEDNFKSLIDEVTDLIPSLDDITDFFTTTIPAWGVAAFNYLSDNLADPIIQWFNDLGDNINYNILGQGTPPENSGWNQTLFTVPFPSTRDEADDFIGSVKEALTEPRGAFSTITASFLRGALALTAIAAGLEPYIEETRQEANASNPTELIGVPLLIDAQYKGLVTPDAAVRTAALGGVSGDDYSVLYAQASYTPSVEEAASWAARGFIDQNAFLKYAQDNHAGGTTGETIQKATVRPVSGITAIDAAGRAQAAANGFLRGSLGSNPLPTLNNIYTADLQDPAQAVIDWQNHWSLPPPEWFALGTFRGLQAPDDVSNAAIAFNYPPELASKFLDMSRPIIPVRVATSLYAKGIIDDVTVQGLYAKAGFSAADSAILMQYADSLKSDDDSDDIHSLAKLALGEATGLYNDGVINAQQLNDIYVAHKYSPDAAALAVNYVVLKKNAADRKSAAEDIVNAVDEGNYDEAQGVANLRAQGYTNSEVLRYQKMMHEKKKAKAKAPSEAQIKAMYKAGFLDASDITDYYTSQGYDAGYIPLLTALIVGPPAQDDASGAAGGETST